MPEKEGQQTHEGSVEWGAPVSGCEETALKTGGRGRREEAAS